MRVPETGRPRALWTIHRYRDRAAFERGEPYDRSEFGPNLLLNEGITRLLNLLIGGGGTAYNNANARLGVGNDNTAESATQTDLIGTSAYVAMETSYPSISAQTVTFRAVFDGSTANFAWAEFTVDNGAVSAENLNRKVSDQGTKAAGQIWTLDLDITFS